MTNIIPMPERNDPGAFHSAEPERDTIEWTKWAAAQRAQSPEESSSAVDAVRAAHQLAILSRPPRRGPRATSADVDARFDEWNAGAEQGPARFEQEQGDDRETVRQLREERQHKTEARAMLYVRTHRHQFQRARTDRHVPRPSTHAPTGVSVGRRSRESHGRPRSAVRSGPTRSRAPSSDSDGSEPGPGPSWPGDEWFTDQEAVDIARHVVDICDDLTPARFDAVTFPYLFVDLEGERLANAKLRVFLELPDALQEGFYNAIRIGHATWSPAGAAAEDDRRLRSDQNGGMS
jgi:hypothetical protein